MILSGLKIAEEVEAGHIEISDFCPSRIGPNSYNLRLADKLYTYDTEESYILHDSDGVRNVKRHTPLDMRKEPPKLIEHQIPEEGLVVKPGRLYLGSTVEYTATGKYVPMLEGRSSVGRLGLFIHVTAGFGDIGFKGNWTLEIACLQPIRIYAGVEIGQIYFHTIEGAFVPYLSKKYLDSTGVVGSRLYMDFED